MIKEKRIHHYVICFRSFILSTKRIILHIIDTLQNLLLYAVRGGSVELTHEQNNLQQTARNNKTCISHSICKTYHRLNVDALVDHKRQKVHSIRM